MHNQNYDLALYRIEKAETCLNDSKLLFAENRFMAAANRAYYAIFHSTRAIMALSGEDRKKHSGVIAFFQERYIKSNIFDKKYSHIIQSAFMVRQESDYEDFYVISKKETEMQINNAEDFIGEIKDYIFNYINCDKK